jgi:hypothetical protein
VVIATVKRFLPAGQMDLTGLPAGGRMFVSDVGYGSVMAFPGDIVKTSGKNTVLSPPKTA